MQVTFDGKVYECDSALRGDDYVLLFTSGQPNVSFYGVVDFSAFQLSGGEWSYPYVTLPTDGWQGDSAPYTQNVVYAGVTPSNDVLYAPRMEELTSKDLDVLTAAKISATYQGDGYLTFTAFGDKPKTDVKFNVKTLF